MTIRKVMLAALGAALALAVLPTAAGASVKWLCRPGLAKSPCAPNLRTTVFSSFAQKLAVETPKPTARRIDCFYVYPTVSNESTTVSDKAAAPEIRSQALYHVARFSQVCRVFAPLYRQITVQGLQRLPTAHQRAFGDKDLLEAWKLYLARFNKGRPFVLIGHSQGAFRLTTLIRRQIDHNPRVRRRLLSAILLGGNVTVRAGSDRGGSFQNVPACGSATQVGCVIGYSTFNQTPPSASLFGRTQTPGLQVLCTNPGALGGGSATLDSIWPSAPFAASYIAAGIQLLHFALPKVSTPFLEAKAAFSGECATEDGASFLKLTSLEGTPVPSASPTPGWGLHLLDVNVAQGDLVRLVESEARAYANRP